MPNKKRLNHLIEVLETVREKRQPFNLKTWMGETDDIAKANVGRKNDCGTACCALGYAALDPEFMKQGLKMELVIERHVPIEGASEDDSFYKRFTVKEEKVNVTSLKEYNLWVKKDSDPNSNVVIMEVSPIYETKRDRQDDPYSAAADFFQISEYQARFLFDPWEYKMEKPTPAHVIERIREVLKPEKKAA